MFNLHALHHQQVRDLAYSCFSEPLLKAFAESDGEDAPAHCSLHLTGKRLAWLHDLDRQPGALISFIDSVQPRRLGLYHETLWHFFLQQDEEVELIANNCQVRQGGKTLGEFDVIYRQRDSGDYVHLELAFKVYLRAPNKPGSSLAHWLGPNVNDRLDRKLEHMRNHQCQLSTTDAGRQLLGSMGIDQVKTEMSLRGHLLQGAQPNPGNHSLDLTSPDLRGDSWLPVSKVQPLLHQSERWTLLSSLEWISPINPRFDGSYEPDEFAAYLEQHFERSDAPVMICAVGTSESTGLIERFRMMVTPNNWPG